MSKALKFFSNTNKRYKPSFTNRSCIQIFKKKCCSVEQTCSVSLALQYPRWDMLHQEAIDPGSLFFSKYQSLDDCHGNTGTVIDIQGGIRRERKLKENDPGEHLNVKQSTWGHFWLLFGQQPQFPCLSSVFPAQGTTQRAAASSHLFHQPSLETLKLCHRLSLEKLIPLTGQKLVPSQPTIWAFKVSSFSSAYLQELQGINRICS